MIVCSCNVLSDGQIKACLQDGGACPRSVPEVYTCLGCSPKCGRCAKTIAAIMRDLGVTQAAPHVCPAGSTCCTDGRAATLATTDAREHSLDVVTA